MLADDLAKLEPETLDKLAVLLIDGWALGPAYFGNPLTSETLPKTYELMNHYPVTAVAGGDLSGRYERLMGRELIAATDRAFTNKSWHKFWPVAKKRPTALKIFAIWDGNEGVNTSRLVDFLNILKRKKIHGASLLLSVADKGLADSQFFKQYQRGDWPLQITVIGGSDWLNDNSWDWVKTNLAYQATVLGLGPTATNVDKYLGDLTMSNAPLTLVDRYGQPLGLADNDDFLIFLAAENYQWRQLAAAILSERWTKFERLKTIKTTNFSDAYLGGDLNYQLMIDQVSLPNLTIATERLSVIADSNKLPIVEACFSAKPPAVWQTVDLMDQEAYLNNWKQAWNKFLNDETSLAIGFNGWLEQAALSGEVASVITEAAVVDELIAWLADKLLSVNGGLIVTSTYGWLNQLWDAAAEKFVWSANAQPLPLMIISQALLGKSLSPAEYSGDLSALPVTAQLAEIVPAAKSLIN